MENRPPSEAHPMGAEDGRLAAATAELEEAHDVLDASGAPFASAGGSLYSLPDRIKLALAEGSRAREAMATVAAISGHLAALMARVCRRT